MSESSETILVPIDAIVEPPWQPSHNQFRKYDPAAAERLAQTIAAQGMINPVVVRRVPGSDPPLYQRVVGMHRIGAHRLLERTEIEARVIEAPDANAELIALMENLVGTKDFSGPAREGDTPEIVRRRDKINRDIAIARAEEIYRQAHPSAAARSESARAARTGGEATVFAQAGVETREDEAPTEKVKPFAETVPDMSPRTVRKRTQIGRALGELDEGAREAIARSGATDEDLLALSNLDQERRQEAVELIHGGASMDEVNEILSKPPEEKPAKEAPAPVEHMSDEEWLASLSEDVVLPDGSRQKAVRERCVRSYFDFHALWWRRMAEHRRAFMKAHDRTTTKLREVYGEVVSYSGSPTALMNAAMGISHPKHWMLCGTCGGQGGIERKDQQVAPCRDCGGGGFKCGQAPRQKPGRVRSKGAGTNGQMEPATAGGE